MLHTRSLDWELPGVKKDDILPDAILSKYNYFQQPVAADVYKQQHLFSGCAIA
jgi:hypothetical protein